jgi:hypothetical protein
MRLRTLSVAGIGTAALVLAGLQSGAAPASGSDAGVALHASGVASHGGSATAAPAHVGAAGKCGTSFGRELPSPDGLIAWNDGGTFDTAGGADIVCTAIPRTKITKVKAYGYYGAVSETFHVTFYRNSTTSGSNEPNDAAIKCDYPALTGAAGGAFPTHVLTTLTLPTPCKLKPGTYWVSIQNVSAVAWYWEMRDTVGGNTKADWVDRFDAFSSGCTTFDNDRYMVDCLPWTYPDYMLKLG